MHREITTNASYTGPYLERVRRVQLHPSILDNGCMHPSIFRLLYAYNLSSHVKINLPCTIFEDNCQNCTHQLKSLSTLVFLIKELLVYQFLESFSDQLILIRNNSFINFHDFFQPTCLLGTKFLFSFTNNHTFCTSVDGLSQ